MAGLFALVSPGGSPGVTTAAVALALTWPAPVVVAECDPSGGDVLAGALAGHVPARQGLMELAIEAGRTPVPGAASLDAQLVPLVVSRTRMVLPGLTAPRQAAGLTSAWPALAATLAAHPADVIADCGRLDASEGQPLAVLAAARTLAVVLRPTLRQAWAARSRIEMLARLLGGTAKIVLLVTGPGQHSPREMAGTLGIPVAATLADDARTAAVLSDGLGRHKHTTSAPLLNSAKVAGHALRRHSPALATAHTVEGGARN